MSTTSRTTVPIGGTADDRFGALRDLFERNLANGDELGASFAVLQHGRPLVDLWGGWADGAKTREWQSDTLTNVWSLSKTVSSLAVLVLIDRGYVDPEGPVAHYWPEFGSAGKEGVLVKHLLMHTSGVSGWDQPIAPEDILDLDAATARLAAQAPWWPPGTASGYHLLDYGHLLHGLVRAVTGRGLGQIVAEDLAAPLGADFWLGLPDSVAARVSHVVPPPPSPLDMAALPPDSPAFKTFTGPALGAEITWTPQWRRAGIGAAGGQGNARSVALLNAVIAGRGEVDGVRVLRAETVDRVFAEPIDGIDCVLGIPLRWGLGFGLRHPDSTNYIPEGRIAFWGGWGGSIVTADVDHGITFAYVMNRMEAGLLPSRRTVGYLNAVYDAL